jgi:hypothetical protein
LPKATSDSAQTGTGGRDERLPFVDLFDEFDGDALLDQLCQFLRVPIGQADAAMAIRLADL